MKLKDKISDKTISIIAIVITLLYSALACVYYFCFSLRDTETAGLIFWFGVVGVITLLLLIKPEKKVGIINNVIVNLGMIFFFVSPVIVFARSVNKYQSMKYLIDSRSYIYAEFDHMESSYYAVLKYEDENTGKEYFFNTDTFRYKSQTPVKKDEAVKIYVDLSKPEKYLISYKEKINVE